MPLQNECLSLRCCSLVVSAIVLAVDLRRFSGKPDIDTPACPRALPSGLASPSCLSYQHHSLLAATIYFSHCFIFSTVNSLTVTDASFCKLCFLIISHLQFTHPSYEELMRKLRENQILFVLIYQQEANFCSVLQLCILDLTERSSN